MDAPWCQLNNFLVVRLDNIGDVVILSPALRAIRENLPGCRITLLASPAGSSVASLLPEIDDVITWRAVWQDVGNRMALDPAREMELVQTLRKRCFDAAIIFTSFSQTPYGVAYACYLAGIPLRLGHSKEFGGSLLNVAFKPPDDGLHQAERNLRLLESAGFSVRGRDLRLRIPRAASGAAMAMLREAGIRPGDDYVLLHPGASCAARTYPAERFAAATDALFFETRLPVVITGGERDRAMAGAVAGGMRYHPVDLTGRTSVPEWAALVRGARLLLSSHTGSIHFADAFRTPSVILYSGTDRVSQWAPRRLPSHVLYRPVDCSPCYAFSCPRGSMQCLDVTPEEVRDAAIELLAQTTGAAFSRAPFTSASTYASMEAGGA